jgi:hypothetical protein
VLGEKITSSGKILLISNTQYPGGYKMMFYSIKGTVRLYMIKCQQEENYREKIEHIVYTGRQKRSCLGVGTSGR